MPTLQHFALVAIQRIDKALVNSINASWDRCLRAWMQADLVIWRRGVSSSGWLAKKRSNPVWVVPLWWFNRKVVSVLKSNFRIRVKAVSQRRCFCMNAVSVIREYIYRYKHFQISFRNRIVVLQHDLSCDNIIIESKGGLTFARRQEDTLRYLVKGGLLNRYSYTEER